MLSLLPRLRLVRSETIKTHCPHCAVHCGMMVTTYHGQEQRRFAVSAEPDFPVNRGQLCREGVNGAVLIEHPARLRSPQLRGRNGKLTPVSWETALGFIASKITALYAQYGAGSVTTLGCGALSNEKAYLLGKFARVVLGSPQIDCIGRFGIAAALAGQRRAFGIDRGLPFPVADIGQAKALLLWGASSAQRLAPIAQWVVEQKSRRGGQLIVVDPERTETARAATLHLQLTPGSDVALANGLLRIAIAERLIDLDYIAKRTEGFDAVRRCVLASDSIQVERLTGVPHELQRRAVRLLANSESSMALSGAFAERSMGNDAQQSIINLMLALGTVGKRASGYGCLTANKGRGVDELLDSIGPGSGVRGLLLFGANADLTLPNAASIARKLEGLDLLVVCGGFQNEVSAVADVLLPTAHWAEEDGTMTNLAGRVVLRRRAQLPPAGIKTDLDVLAALASGLGHPEGFQFASSREVFDELRRTTAGSKADYSGLTYERLEEQQGIFWPCPNETHPGTPRLFTHRFAHASGRARFHAVPDRLALPIARGFGAGHAAGDLRSDRRC